MLKPVMTVESTIDEYGFCKCPDVGEKFGRSVENRSRKAEILRQ